MAGRFDVKDARIDQVDSRGVKTKRGTRQTYSFKSGNDWYRTNFDDHKLAVGDVVSFTFEESQWGKEVDISTLTKTGSAPAATSGGGSGNQEYTGKKGRYDNFVFPVPPTSGDQSI